MPQPAAPPPGHTAVRLTIRPDDTVHVPDDEVPVLRQQGLLKENEPGTGTETSAGKTPAGKDKA